MVKQKLATDLVKFEIARPENAKSWLNFPTTSEVVSCECLPKSKV